MKFNNTLSHSIKTCLYCLGNFSMANTRYDIELNKSRSIVYLSLFFFVQFEAEWLCPKLSPNQYNMANELLASEK